MMLWLLVNAALGILTLLFLGLNRSAPQRLRFHVCVMGMSVWLIPWHLLAELLPVAALLSVPLQTLPLTSVLADIALPTVSAITQPTAQLGITPALLLGFATAAGSVLFLLTLLRHMLLIRTLAASSTGFPAAAIDLHNSYPELLTPALHTPPVRVQNVVPGALTTGIFKPVIWVHAALVEDAALACVLQHELMHIRQRDNAWLCFITCIEKLLWWNPLVQLCAGKARRLLELSCDAACQNEVPTYRSSLNSLILKLSRTIVASSTNPPALCAAMFKDANFNVERIRQLERRSVMRTKNYLSAGMLGTAAVFVIGCATVFSQSAAPGAEPRTAQIQQGGEARPVVPEVEAVLTNIESSEGPTQTERESWERRVRAGLEVYASKMEESLDALRDSNSKLEARVVELEQQIERLE